MIDPRILRAMEAAGATPDLIIAAIEADHAIEEEARAEKRAKAAARKRKSRAGHAASHDVTQIERDTAGQTVTNADAPTPSPLSPSPSFPPHPPNNPLPLSPHPSELRSGAVAPRDVRRDLFDRGLKTLATITGKTPDSCRSLVGKWLKSVNDEAIHVLGAIDDAERNRVADPVAWINKALQPRTRDGQRNNVIAAADALVDHMKQWEKTDEPDMLEDLRGGTGASDVRVLPAHGRG